MNHHVMQLTSVHQRYDGRIFQKQCRSLVAGGYRVTLVVADGKGNETKDGVEIIDVGKAKNRWERIAQTRQKILAVARSLQPRVCHFHDPELLLIAKGLKRLGAAVIYDAHEDVARQLLTKPYLNPWAARVLSFSVARYERIAFRHLTMAIGATPSITTGLQQQGLHAQTVNNYPFIEEFEFLEPGRPKQAEIAFFGGITKIRGLRHVIDAMPLLPGIRLNLGGNFTEPAFERELKSRPGWASVNELGFLDRRAMAEKLGQSHVGLVTYLPVPNHVEAQPNKLFEYMAAGIPIIASDFPLWRQIVADLPCGRCVNPESPTEIAQAVQFVLEHPAVAQQWAANGRAAIRTRFNWQSEERKLLEIYRGILN
jgi:glycosyltransferase involved in cell wall biosynthesis